MESGVFPEKIIAKVLKRCPPDVAFNIGSTCRRYNELLLQSRGIPINKAIFQPNSCHFEIYEEEPSKLTLDCGTEALQDPNVCKLLREISLYSADVQLISLSADEISQIIDTVKSITPLSLILVKSKLSSKDFKTLTRRPLIGLHLTSDVAPFPKFEEVLHITRYAEFLLMCVRKVQLCANIKDLLMNWDRTPNLQVFKIRGVPPTFTLQDIVDVSKRYAYPGLQFTVSYVESVTMEDIKAQLHTLQANYEIPATVSIIGLQGEKPKVYLLPVFMRLSPSQIDMSIECFGISISF